MTLKHRLVALVSALAIFLAIVVLPGCKKEPPASKTDTTKTTTTEKEAAK